MLTPFLYIFFFFFFFFNKKICIVVIEKIIYLAVEGNGKGIGFSYSGGLFRAVEWPVLVCFLAL